MSRRIFSLDYGRGNMAAFYGDIDVPNPEYKPLMADGGEPSGFARMKDGSITVGKRIYAVNPSQVASYHINFKAIPNEQNRAIMIEYARAWREFLMKRNPAAFSEGEHAWLIGIPTGWRKKEIVDAYREIFVEADYPNPIIVPESNAAMYNAQKSYGAMERASAECGLLCLDYGAYSNDATYILPGEVFSYGGFTGAALIEQMILLMNLRQQFKLSKKEHNSPELVAAVCAKYKSDPKFRQYLTLQARQLKELYYTNMFDGKSYASRDLPFSVPLDEEDKTFAPFVEEGDDFFVLYMNDVLAKEILEDQSIRSVLGEEFSALPEESKAEIGEKTWMQCMRSFLSNTLHICSKLAEAGKSGKSKPIVLLTGGATRMPFIEDIVNEMLPNAEIYKDEAPMDTIGKGLWLFGPDKLKAMEFDAAFQRVVEEKDAAGKLVMNNIISEAHDVLGNEILIQLAVKPSNFIVDAANEWREYECDSSQIVSRARSSFKAYFNGGLRALLPERSKACKEYIAEEVNKRFDGLLKEHGIERAKVFVANELDITYVDSFLQDIIMGDEVFSLIDEQIKEEEEIYDKLPNPGKFNILSRRGDILSELADKLNQRNKGWREWVYKILKELYDDNRMYHPFLQECLYELYTALERQKKQMLGELIVEDIADED